MSTRSLIPRILRFALAGLLLAGCVIPPDELRYSAAPNRLRDHAAGCWRLESARHWLWGRLIPPMVVRLHTLPARHYGLAVEVFGERRRDFDQWGTYAGGDSLAIILNNGFSGVEIRALVQGDRLRGRGRGWSDVIPSPSPRGTIRGERVPCPTGNVEAAPGDGR